MLETVISDKELDEIASGAKRYYAMSSDTVLKLIEEIRRLKAVVREGRML